ncbi:MAG: 4-alpha-glucanotransferase [Candidatus Pseudobacter hemicellulosilyticus]|uniref:4-alpha-glucanotransferase n=1 Tax=Candidatus Pseudobacter hemicellulosilyticus TaxID=3121375 RepID=A0AAJ6BEE0_9BACT|nr:MAG: 4-alpha-glucanotransferase [Pseudobacter sp.]
MRIHFYIRFHTKYGQQLAVTGNIETLGAEDTSKAFTLSYLNNDYWHGTLETDLPKKASISYQYLLRQEDGLAIREAGQRSITLPPGHPEDLVLIDTWNHAGEFENVFYTDPFQEILLKGNETKVKVRSPKHFTHQFRVKAPLLGKNEVVCLTGSHAALGEWDNNRPLLLSREDGWWTARVSLPLEAFPLHYKYGVYNIKEDQLVQYEAGENRALLGDAYFEKLTILHDGFVHLPNTSWKGAGVSIPVFSLRSKQSFGAGEFPDLKLLVDWAKKTGLQVIQILPVNDSQATHTWLDTYPYAAISAFALHPLYLNMEQVAGKAQAELMKPLKKKQKQLNELPDMDYEEVMHYKLMYIRELYAARKEELFQDEHYQAFFENNRHWLVPYAAFSYLRDKYKTSDFNQWKTHSRYDAEAVAKLASPRAKQYDKIAIHYFTQYHLHLQLKDAASYAHKQGVILKGDIPIGVYRYGCDAWMEPELYHMDVQAGAPPDDFAVSGQNWGFPTYNWERMAADGFEWWRRRFAQMGNYFDAFRIDHILGFFRIWSIPMDAVEGILGYFVPAIPLSVTEFQQKNIWFDHQRYCKPYISDSILWELFGPNKDKFLPFLHAIGDGHYELKPEFATQRQVEAWFADKDKEEDTPHLRQGLYNLISNVLLIEQPGSEGQSFHFRIGMDNTPSFRRLAWDIRQQLKPLYDDYFYSRQDNRWMKEAMKKLPALKRSTNMLVCGEDLGMVPACVPEVMRQLGILSLELQRMPKDASHEFLTLSQTPYLSVVTPSTHDMSTIRGWWEEDEARTQRFYNQELKQEGTAPAHCEAWINREVILQHLHAPAMWSIFQLQDLLGMDEQLRRPTPQEERINIPATSKHYWRYRMHLPLEQLIKEKTFNESLATFVKASGRS